MNKQTFIQLVKDPSGITPEQLLELEKVVAGFPYSQAAHILIAKQAAETGSMLADQKLKKAAAYTLDRKNLKKILASSKGNSTSVQLPVSLVEEDTIKEKVTEKLQEITPEISSEKQDPPADLIVVSPDPDPTPVIPPVQEIPEADLKRDQLIKELEENLKKLHSTKRRIAWEEDKEDVSEDTKEKDTVKEDEPSGLSEPTHTSQSFSENTENNIPDLPDDPNEHELPEEKKNLTPTEYVVPVLQKHATALPVARPLPYPLRTEDVVVEVREIEADTSLLLDYLTFLEEKRSVFRKNKKKEEEIISRIIKSDPTIPKLDINNLPDNSVDLSSKSSSISKGPVSENFAKILSLQGKRDKAIEIYEQLILKNPEKKPYFEAQIEKLKNKI